MRTTLVVSVTALALACATAFAAPRAMSSAELDTVAAGAAYDQSVTEFLNLITPAETVDDASVSAAQLPYALDAMVVTAEPNSIGVSATGSTVATAGAVAATNGLAINGDRNLAVDLSGDIAVGFAAAGQDNIVADQDDSDIAVLATDHAVVRAANIDDNDVDDGSAMVVGIDNHTTVATDASSIDGCIVADAQGVIAGQAEVSDSFNYEKVCIDVCAYIDDSFNVVKNSMDICGQNNASAIVNANTLGCAEVGTNLNVTTADATVASKQYGDTGFGISGSLIAGNAIGVTIQHQVVANGLLLADTCVSF